MYIVAIFSKTFNISLVLSLKPHLRFLSFSLSLKILSWNQRETITYLNFSPVLNNPIFTQVPTICRQLKLWRTIHYYPFKTILRIQIPYHFTQLGFSPCLISMIFRRTALLLTMTLFLMKQLLPESKALPMRKGSRE